MSLGYLRRVESLRAGVRTKRFRETYRKNHIQATRTHIESSTANVTESHHHEAHSSWAYSLSPVMSLPCVFLCISYTVMWTECIPNPFASFSNITFTAVGFQRLVIMFLLEDTFVLTLGVIVASPFFYIIVGASSLSFHLRGELNSPEHYFDLLSGMLLMTHVMYVSLVANVYCFVVTSTMPCRKVFVLVVSTVYVTALTVLIVHFDAVYDKQDVFYLSMSLCTAFLFMSLIYKLVPTCLLTTKSALLEVVTVMSCVLGATVSQCEFAGRRYEMGSVEYDFYHGNWHFLLAVGTSIICSRCSDVTAVVVAKQTKPIVAPSIRASVADTIGKTGLTLYGCLLIFLKETGVNIMTTRAVMSTIAFSLGLYAVAVVIMIAVQVKSDLRHP
jgi:hypothetical protein